MMQEWLPSKLRVLRAQRGLTLIEAAEKAGVGRDTLSDIERGRRHPVMPTLAKIAAGYGVPVEELLEAEPVPLGEAPEAGRPDESPEEEERRVVRAFLSAYPSEEARAELLASRASTLGGYNARWTSEIKDIEKNGTFPYGRSIEMRVFRERLSEVLRNAGILDYMDRVNTRQMEASPRGRAACKQLLEEYVEMLNLANRMRAVEHANCVTASEDAERGLEQLEGTLLEPSERDA